MDKIIKLEEYEDFKMFDPVLTLNEDISFDNRFCVLNTSMGNIAFSYYELGIAPSFIIQNNILFINFGKSCYVIDLIQNKVLYQSNNLVSIIFEIIQCNSKSCVVFIGEFSLLCFSVEGNLIWKNTYKNIIFDWEITNEGLLISFENGDKTLILFENGNGVPVAK